MKIVTASSTHPDIEKAALESIQDIRKELSDINYLIVFATVEYDIDKLVDILNKEYPKVQIHGGTSCKGVMTASGFHSDAGRAMSFFALSDPDGSYGVGYAGLDENPQSAASKAIHMAINNAERPGETPKLVFLTAPPGYEEEIIHGLEDVVGRDVPIAGGSSADNAIEGKWKQFINDRSFQNAVVVSAFFPSVNIDIGVSFSSGYLAANKSGIATKAKGRTLYEIDNKPAAIIYNKWTGGIIKDALKNGGNVLQYTTLHPIGREVGKIGDVPYYILSHPESITKEGAINMFTEINEGDHLELMTGSLESLFTRAGRVARFILDNELLVSKINGALVIYCAGCMLTVDDKMDQVIKGINDNLDGAPFLGIFTFGEQGCFKNGENHHGNLMITVIIFGCR